MSEAVALHHRYHEAIRRRDFEGIEAMLAPTAAYRSVGVGALEGRAAILDAFRRYFAVHPDQVDGDESIEPAAADASLARWWLTATNIETGETIRRRGTERLTLDSHGRIHSVEVADA